MIAHTGFSKKFFLGLFFLSFLFCCKPIEQKYALVDDAGNPTKELLELLEVFGIKHDGTLTSMVKETQQNWLQKIRPANKERWEIEEEVTATFEQKKEQAIPLFKKIGLYNTWKPSKKEYDYAFILGCRLVGFCNRLKQLIELEKQGISFKNLVFLTGERPLMNEETPEQLEEQFKTVLTKKPDDRPQEFPTTESTLIEYIVNHTVLPDSWHTLQKIFIKSAMKKNNQNVLVRPTTGDTIEDWLKTNPKQGTILAISNQPHCHYQHAVLKTLLPGYNIETAGSEIDEKISVALMLDALARALYQEHERLKVTTFSLQK